MKQNFCKKPCSECPFRNISLNGYLGGFSPEITYMTAVSEQDFHCHPTRTSKNKKQCAGRLLLASTGGKIFRRPDLEAMRKEVVKNNPNYKDEILNGATFIKHHKKKIGKTIR
jgi:hypothetical protein